ncbi:CRISPR system Cascade subunit CasB [Actinopolyspora xinjiangensis]|uniref:CRISPR system Cascade subunit CasB n=1 Tax=Actinopolyspora xinjiangensis TaxID=405564 RepID=A0A1H0X0M0_9ACTN|nr:type I-E CRISPR-associated protein Cse2/CasB [Actinopolyspora xinjiangensis]SDP96514.1 CRISPR system Cascade subunit CasB [Actinopolyspora xinjiangensis]
MARAASDYATRFVTDIATQATANPAVRTALRTGLGREPDQCHRMHAFVAPWLEEDSHPDKERVHYTIAALIAHAPETAVPTDEDASGDLGESLARAAQHHVLASATTENYLHLVVRQNPGTLCRYLTTVVLSLRDTGIPVDFARLFDDAGRWPWQSRRIAKTWLQSYYRSVASKTSSS